MPEIVLTREGLERLEQELEHLRTVGRQEVADRLRDALTGGTELAENAEYLEAKEEQGRLEQRIAQLEERLAEARVVDAADVPEDRVAIGSHVRLKDLQTNETLDYEIVGSGEGNPVEGKVSGESPVGGAVLGHAKGDVVEVEAPRGVRRLKVLSVEPAGAATPAKRATKKQPPKSKSPSKPTKTSSKKA